ncbi:MULTISPECIES: hypothetical protein [unclassified Helicobacter]|uniref:hypothetical protein n=1 Tax=Helicobacter TaxID=209 RepID=UPI00244D7EA7|nr:MULTISPECIES: hypothetical protein [unclassified Helicobacter]BEG57194.1 hypothetical protein NHP21005_08820 [Helicobacter sp. NHP21005]GMB95621.1 hypothetical protein NHP22001_02100 [Helicobacter sp. NHP22-001]
MYLRNDDFWQNDDEMEENQTYKQGMRGLKRILNGGKSHARPSNPSPNANPFNDDPFWDAKISVEVTTTDGKFLRKFNFFARDTNRPLKKTEAEVLFGDTAFESMVDHHSNRLPNNQTPSKWSGFFKNILPSWMKK